MAVERVTEIKTMTTYDGCTLQGKLDLPVTDTVGKLVYFVNSSGPHTYDNHRIFEGREFNYYDLFAEQLTARGIGLFRHNTRGVTPGSEPPMYCTIDKDLFKTYLPENSLRDVLDWIGFLKQDSRLQNVKIYLLGWSEGSMLAPAAALRAPEKIDGLLLAGYVNGTMEEVLEWQQTGGSSMVNLCAYFDYDGDGAISRAEFDEDRYGVKTPLGLPNFEDIDKDGDGRITRNDIKVMLEPSNKALYEAIENHDDAWFAANYPVTLTTGWLHAYRAFPPNRETMPKLDLPIHIFHGKLDANVSFQSALEIDTVFKKLGKNNLTVHIYDKADHDLNYMLYIVRNEIPQPITDIFDICRQL